MDRDDPSTAPPPASLAEVADALSDGLAVCRDGRIVWANARLAELAGAADADALVGSDWAGLLESAELPEAGSGRAAAVHLKRGDEARSLVVRSLRAAGADELWVVQDQTHVRSLEEEVLRLGRELHRLYRDLERMRERARREVDDREELLTVVAHELRTPATVISGYNKLLLSGEVGPLNEEQRRFLHESTKSCQKLNAFIGNLLEASRQVAGDAPLQVCQASLEPTVRGVAAFLKPLLEEHDLTIEVDVDPGAALARFDPVRIEQVLTNLVSNAIRYARVGGRVEIAVRPVERDALSWVEVAVTDDGPGVPVEDRERIFLPYVRSAEGRSAGGLGLGLAICKRIVEAHGGVILAAEGPRGGGRFCFTLPAPARSEAGART